jgi:hypothetical protein
MKRLSALFLSFLLFVIFSVSFVFSVKWSSPLRQFNVTPDVIYLNWTNNYASNITVTINETYDNITVEILNGTAVVTANYSQSNSAAGCLSGGGGYYLFTIDVNESNSYDYLIGILNATNSSTVTIIDDDIIYNHLQCSSGRYSVERFTLRNWDRTNETANITVFIDIPISSYNNANLLTDGTGNFSGTFTANSTNYHSYFFNTSAVPNASSVHTSITWSDHTKDLDMFLFGPSGNLKEKSITKEDDESRLVYSGLPSNEIWEIRIYGNFTSGSATYTGNIYFSTLNVTNADTNEILDVIDFGNMNVSSWNTTNITLRNEGSINLTDVSQNVAFATYKTPVEGYNYGLYHEHSFNGSGDASYEFLVPASAQEVMAVMNWTGSGYYNLSLYMPNGSFYNVSSNKSAIANLVGAMKEEFVWKSSPSEGLWRIVIRNTTPTTDMYTVRALTWVSSTNWISTNYNTTTFNSTYKTQNFSLNISVPSSAIDGLYKGTLFYSSSNRYSFVKFKVNVTTPVLTVNNTFSTLTTTINENYGSTLNRTISLFLNNTGSFDLNVNIINSSNNLTCASGSCSVGIDNATFTFNPISSIGKHNSTTLNVNVTINASLQTGIYEGWVYLNATDSTTSLSSHPYGYFNVSLKLNLTNHLDVRTLELNSLGNTIIEDISDVQNFTIRFKVYYINGTEIEAGNSLSVSNFTIWLTHQNITTFRLPTSGGLSLFNGTNPIYWDNDYEVGANVSANQPGGRYNVYVTASYTRNTSSFSGTGINQTLIINNTGLNLTCVSCPASFANSSSTTVNISITNYGWADSSLPIITYTKGSYISTVTYLGISSNCGASGTPSSNVTISSVAANGTQTCYVAWTITASSSGGSNRSVISVSNAAYFSVLPHYYTVTTPSTSTTTTTATTDVTTAATTTAATTTTTVAPSYLEITSYPSTVTLEQGNSTTQWVKVKNTNKTISQSVTLSVLSLNTSWYNIPAPTVTIPANGTNSYLVKFNVSIDAGVGDYNGKFNASSRYGSVLKSFVLTVTPSIETKRQINFTIAEYQSQLTLLETQINDTNDKGYNTSEADKKFSELKNKINSAINYRNNGDYKSAYQTFITIDNLFNETRTALSLATLPKTGIGFGDWWGWGKWIIIGVAGVAAGFLGYLFWPTPGYHLEKGYAPQPKVEVRSRFKDRLEKLRERWNKIREKKEKTKYIPPSV